jgi:DNA-binding SARP family transcriptional activator
MYELQLFGTAAIEGPDGPLSGRILQRRQVALLAVLALAPGRSASRDKLLALFRPEADAQRARHGLADTVYVIRKALGEDALRSVSDDLVLDPQRVGSDVAGFAAALAVNDAERAVSLYRGPLLDGFHLSEAPEFERWLAGERERLGLAHARALEELAGESERQGDRRGAVEWWRRLAGVEPYNARVALGLMRALVASGDRAGAIRHGEVHATLLREEFEAEPEPELVAYMAAVRSGSEGGLAPVARAASSPEQRSELPVADELPPVVPSDPARVPQTPATDAEHSRTVRHGRLRWAIPIGAAGFLAFAVAVGTVLMPRAMTPEVEVLDANVIVPLPFRSAGADPALTYLREGMVELIAAKLGGDEGLRAADPGTVLSAWRRSVASEAEDLPRDSALQVARRLGAGRMLVGGIVGTPANVSIHASILDVRLGRTTGQASVQGSEDELHELVDRLIAELLSRSAGEEEHRLANLTSASPPALRAFLAGRAAHRRGDYEEALRQYLRAVELDSTFALAGLELNRVSGWVGGSGSAARLGGTVASRYRERLSARDRVRLLERSGASDIDGVMTASERLESRESALRRWPDHAELWYLTGDIYFHQGSTLGIEEWETRARRSFERAMELNADFAEPVHHLASIFVQLGDTAALRTLTARQLDRDSVGSLADYLRWLARHTLGDTSPFRVPPLESMDPDATLRWIGIEAQDFGFAIADGPRAVQLRLLLPGIRDEQLERRLGTFSYALNMGRTRESLTHWRALPEVQPDPHFHLRLAILTALYADGDEETGALAAEELARAVPEGAFGELNACVLAQWRLQVAGREREVGTGPIPAAPPQPGEGAAVRHVCALVRDALASVGSDGGPQRQPVERLDALLRTGPNAGLVDHGHTEYAHIALARLHEAAGNPAAALAALRRRALYHGWQPYLATHLREEGRLAAALGDTAGAIRAYEHFLAFRSEPEPHLRADTERVRLELARLKSASDR